VKDESRVVFFTSRSRSTPDHSPDAGSPVTALLSRSDLAPDDIDAAILKLLAEHVGVARWSEFRKGLPRAADWTQAQANHHHGQALVRLHAAGRIYASKFNGETRLALPVPISTQPWPIRDALLDGKP